MLSSNKTQICISELFPELRNRERLIIWVNSSSADNLKQFSWFSKKIGFDI